jgi:hypothetical protein
MNWFWLNVPLMALFFAAFVGIPLWLVLRRPDARPASQPTVDMPAPRREVVAWPVSPDAVAEEPADRELVGAR